MTAFCVEKIHCDERLRAEHGVLTELAFAVTNEARAVAEQTLLAAKEQAAHVLEYAHVEAEGVVQEAERDTLQRADELLQVLVQTNAAFLDGAQDTIVELAQALFSRLVLETPPREQVEAAFRRVQQQAPTKLASPLLRVHPEDFDLVPTTEWEVKVDPTLSRGTCRLEAAGGEWCASFTAAVAALQAAFDKAVEESAGGQPQ